MTQKDRIDKILVSKKIVKNRKDAVALILSGNVFLNTKIIDKPGFILPIDSNLQIKNKKDGTWVSRGGYKLDKAIKYFSLICDNVKALDIGCGSGGFSDVLLKHGAKKIYCIDVGYGQLDWKIRTNENVFVFEKTNARYIDEKIIKDTLDIIVCDASFISLKKILPASLKFLKRSGYIIALIKPQFEIGKNLVGKGGIVKNPEHHDLVVNDIKNWFTKEINFKVCGVIESPILGSKGNKEFLICALKK